MQKYISILLSIACTFRIPPQGVYMSLVICLVIDQITTRKYSFCILLSLQTCLFLQASTVLYDQDQFSVFEQ